MPVFERLKGSSAKWYLLGIATAVAAGAVSRDWRPPTPLPDSTPPPLAVFEPSSEAIELVIAARARERDGDSTGARSAYLEAAPMLSAIGDYLRLRAAQLTADSTARSLLYQAINTRPARDQVGLAEARILERKGNFAGAAREREQLGQFAEAFRLRLLNGRDQATRGAVLAAMEGWMADSANTASRSAVAAAALPYIRELTPSQLLTLARSSAIPTGSSPAPAFYERAVVRGVRLVPADYAAWGEALFARGRYRESITQLRRVTSGPALPRSLLLRGRAILRSGQSGGRAILEELVRRFPRDSAAVPTALFLLGDLARDAGDYTTARRRWSELATRFPSSHEAPRARFLVGMIQYSRGERFGAAQTWDSLFSGGDGREEALSGGYWAGRALFESGDVEGAWLRWRGVIARSRLSYYSRLSYRRLGLVDSTLARGEDQFANSPYLESARQRLQLLAATGLTPELGIEITWLAAQAGNDLTTVLGTGSLLRSHYRATHSAQLGWRALDAGAAEPKTYRLIFPLLFDRALTVAARDQGVDPALAAALIRQESLFDSMATSRAGARGLMQIMPSVGRELARAARKQRWHTDSLYHPGVNLQFGTAHLAGALKRYGGLERTLAAYNAGGSRVTRWARYPGSNDPEVFVEWIPFPETRSYVRTVVRNFEFYRGLYDWN
jgi:soluble lytic murein transglycosylase-like protein/tetratricopeptide (TPR) repeat protein